MVLPELVLPARAHDNYTPRPADDQAFPLPPSLTTTRRQAVQRHKAHSNKGDALETEPGFTGKPQEGGVEESAGQARLVDLRDCIACLENDRELAKTEMAYRAYTLLVDDKAEG